MYVMASMSRLHCEGFVCELLGTLLQQSCMTLSIVSYSCEACICSHMSCRIPACQDLLVRYHLATALLELLEYCEMRAG